MTTRLAGFVVILNSDVRDDDAEATINAIRQIKGVQSVAPIEADLTLQIAVGRAKFDLREKLWNALRDE